MMIMLLLRSEQGFAMDEEYSRGSDHEYSRDEEAPSMAGAVSVGTSSLPSY